MKSGQVKVGDIILANPTFNGPMSPCKVLEIVPDPVRADYDGDYVVHCDNAPWTRVAATGDHMRLAPPPPPPPPPNPPAAMLAHRSATTPARLVRAAAPASAPAAVPPPAPGANAFGTREPQTSCPAVRGGTPSPAAAAQLVACAREGQSRQNDEELVADVVVTSMTQSKYNPYTQTGFTNMDTSVNPVEIKGHLRNWSCRPQDPPTVMAKYSNVGHNCSYAYEPTDSGYCWKQRTGTWSCVMSDVTNSRTDRQYDIAPPR